MPNKPKKQNNAVRLLSLITNISITTAVCVLVGVVVGRLLDSWLGTSPLFLLLLLLLGIAAAFKNIYDVSQKIK